MELAEKRWSAEGQATDRANFSLLSSQKWNSFFETKKLIQIFSLTFIVHFFLYNYLLLKASFYIFREKK